ncbi:GNAT family N-acetyltransferase [Bacillus sp. RD4P76]|uniref:GNAT family N-acetyltransferase n=2 Tax=Bacillus suaedaesalsae TaxID=2810349 RepID=A0ABS2DJ43_9BACI|nr:GNAT family N-acetyltransferase [Bacillus suaedaesalsae]
MEIRNSTKDDVAELALLMGQLGYPTTNEEMEVQLRGNSNTLVAIIDGKVVGMIGLVSSYYYEMNGSYVRVVAFVVDTDYRSNGIGKELLRAAEKWAISIGSSGIGLNSGNPPERKEAHSFYRKMGFIEKSIGFAKTLEQ